MDEGSSTEQPRHAGSRPPRRIAQGIGVAALAVLTFTGVGTAVAWYELQGNITATDIGDYLPDPGSSNDGTQAGTPPDDILAGGPVNILVMGSDSREGDNAAYGDTAGMRSDTTLLMHVAADRSRVDVVSVPRDLIVDIPSCILPGGSQSAATTARFNSAFALGSQGGELAAAAACTQRTFEQMSGIPISDFVIVDFSGFAGMVDAIGGVDMCFEQAQEDWYSGLDVEAGCHTLDGGQALSVARARKVEGTDGSDISRIGRQQQLVSAITQRAISADVMTNPAALLSFLGEATSSLTTGQQLANLQTLAGLAYSLRNLGDDDVNFATVPFDYSGNVVYPNASSDVLWQSIAADQPMELPEFQLLPEDNSGITIEGDDDGTVDDPETEAGDTAEG